MSSPRPANPAYQRWFVLGSALVAVFNVVSFVLDAPDRMVLNGVSAVVWSVSAAYWFVTWRRDRATYDQWLEERAGG